MVFGSGEHISNRGRTLQFTNDFVTGKSFSEALILASTNPQYDERLFINLQVQYIKTTSSEHAVYIICFLHSGQFMYTTHSWHVLSLEFSCTELVTQ